jgi:hypothetical protein
MLDMFEDMLECETISEDTDETNEILNEYKENIDV